MNPRLAVVFVAVLMVVASFAVLVTDFAYALGATTAAFTVVAATGKRR